MILRFLVMLGLLVAASGCSIRHEVHTDYPQYLANNRGKAQFVRIGAEAAYYLDPTTVEHRYEFRSGMAGYAHVWVVAFGEMLEDTLRDWEFQQQFTSVRRADVPVGVAGLLLAFRLDDYRFESFGAHVTLTIEAWRGGQILVARTYQGDGITQGGKMFWAAGFGMKNAIQQSTKSALDAILRLCAIRPKVGSESDRRWAVIPI